MPFTPWCVKFVRIVRKKARTRSPVAKADTESVLFCSSFEISKKKNTSNFKLYLFIFKLPSLYLHPVYLLSIFSDLSVLLKPTSFYFLHYTVSSRLAMQPTQLLTFKWFLSLIKSKNGDHLSVKYISYSSISLFYLLTNL